MKSLTPKQEKVMKLRRAKMSAGKVASRLGLNRTSIYVIEDQAIRKHRLLSLGINPNPITMCAFGALFRLCRSNSYSLLAIELMSVKELKKKTKIGPVLAKAIRKILKKYKWQEIYSVFRITRKWG